MRLVKNTAILFCTVLLLCSCSDTLKTSNASGTFLEVVPSQSKEIFYINYPNGFLNLKAKYTDSEGNEKVASTFWETNFPEGTELAFNGPNLTVNLDSIPVLGDYTVTAKCKENENIVSSYKFSLESKDKLSDSLSYSLSTIDNMDFYFVSNLMVIESIKEFDTEGTKIEMPADRMVVGEQIDYVSLYNSNGTKNFVLISPRGNAKFGLLETELKSNNGSEIEIYGTTDGQIAIISKPGQQIVFDIKAGNKDTRTLTINANAESAHPLAQPIYTLANAETHEGKVITITGDNVENDTYYMSEDRSGNTVNVTIKRRALGETGENEFYDYDFSQNEETQDIQYGRKIHLKHTGEYIVTYAIGRFNSSIPVTTEPIIIEPYQISNNPISITWQGAEKINSSRPGAWATLMNGSSTTAINNEKYVVNLDNAANSGVIDYYIYKDGNFLSFDERITDKRYEFSENGQYTIRAVTSYGGSGKGKVYEEEINTIASLYPNAVKTEKVEIKESPYNNTNFIKAYAAEGRPQTVEFTKSRSIPEGYHLYVAAYLDGEFLGDNSGEIPNATAVYKYIYNPSNKNITIKYYLYGKEESRIAYKSSVVSETYGPGMIMPEHAAVVENPDSIQNQFNKRRLRIKITKNPSGQYRPTYFYISENAPFTSRSAVPGSYRRDWKRIDTAVSSDGYYYSDYVLPLYGINYDSKYNNACVTTITEAYNEEITGIITNFTYVNIPVITDYPTYSKDRKTGNVYRNDPDGGWFCDRNAQFHLRSEKGYTMNYRTRFYRTDGEILWWEDHWWVEAGPYDYSGTTWAVPTGCAAGGKTEDDDVDCQQLYVYFRKYGFRDGPEVYFNMSQQGRLI